MTCTESPCGGVPVSSRACSWASGDRPEHGLQSRPRLAGFSSCDQLRVSDATANRRGDHAVEPVERQALHVSVIEPERELVDVAPDVLRAGVVIDAMQPAFQDSPHAFDAVRRHAIADIFARAMVDRAVFEEQADKAAVGFRFVGMQRATGFDVRMNRRVNVRRVCRINRLRNRSAAALAHTHDRDLADSAATGAEFLARVLVRFLTADIGFVNLNDAVKDGRIVSARFAEPVQDEPSRLLRDAYFLRQLQGRNALARRDEQIHGVKPFVQGNVRPLENGSGADAERFLALETAIQTGRVIAYALAKPANRAARAFRPEPPFEVDAGRLIVGEHLEKLERADCDFIVHDSSDPSLSAARFLRWGGSRQCQARTGRPSWPTSATAESGAALRAATAPNSHTAYRDTDRAAAGKTAARSGKAGSSRHRFRLGEAREEAVFEFAGRAVDVTTDAENVMAEVAVVCGKQLVQLERAPVGNAGVQVHQRIHLRVFDPGFRRHFDGALCDLRDDLDLLLRGCHFDHFVSPSVVGLQPHYGRKQRASQVYYALWKNPYESACK